MMPLQPFAATITMAVSLVTSGCILVPTPEFGYGMIPDTVLDSLERGHTTRAEVVLALGDPNRRYWQDRLFVYRWATIRAVVPWVIPYVTAGVVVIPKTHYLCIEFSDDNRLYRVEHIEPLIAGDPDERLTQLLLEWEGSEGC